MSELQKDPDLVRATVQDLLTNALRLIDDYLDLPMAGIHVSHALEIIAPTPPGDDGA